MARTTPPPPAVPTCRTCGARLSNEWDECWADYCPDAMTRRRRAGTWRALGTAATLVLFFGAIGVLIYASNRWMHDDCDAHGGTLLPVYGGRGGWVCMPPGGAP